MQMIHGDITDKILAAYYDVYNELGAGFLESVYGNAVAVVFAAERIAFEKEKAIEVHFRGQLIGEFRADFLVEGKVIVELKACRAKDNSHIAQTLNYLKATGCEVGLILNFGPKPEFKRLVLSKR
jgi:GxxExxY protein